MAQRQAVRGLVGALASTVLLLLAAFGAHDLLDGNPAPVRPALPAAAQPVPARALDRALDDAAGYLNGLYKPVAGGAVQSESYGLPLRVRLPGYHRWVLLGQGAAGDCLTSSPCSGPSTITLAGSGTTFERYRVAFDTPAMHAGVTAVVEVDWSTPPGASVVVTSLRSRDPRSGAELWLDRRRLASVPGDAALPGAARAVSVSDRSAFRSLRYTVRHATQAAFLWNRLTHQDVRAGALRAFLLSNGYRPGADIRAGVLGTAGGLGDDFPFTAAAYPDCGGLPAAGTTAYPYASKVCLAGVGTFLLSGRRDAFLEESEAFQVLADHRDPDRAYPASVRAGMIGGTPRATAALLERAWLQTGYGIPACTPASCETDRVSGLRSVEFGLLETVLGYGYGDAESRRFADLAAAEAVRVQVGAAGSVSTVTGRVLRPTQAGALPIFWDRQGRFAPTSGVTATATERLSMPPEFTGVSVSDTETTVDAWAFLAAYRCARYGAHCDSAPWGDVLTHGR